METPVNEAPASPNLPQNVPNNSPSPAPKRKKWLLPVLIGGGAAIVLAIAAVLFFLFRSSDLPFKPDTSLIPVYDGKKWGYVDQKGKYVINPQFSDAGWFSDGLARVEDKDGKIGFIDKKGTYTIPSKYVNATIFHEGLAFVVEEGGHPVCINKKGDRVFECTAADGVSSFCEGIAPFYTLNDKEETRYGFYDKKGNVVINPQFKGAGFFHEGLAKVSNNDDKWGFIDKNGKYVINPQFDECYPFFEGLAAFMSGDKWGYIDKEGKYAINPQFDEAYNFFNGMAIVKQGDRYGYIDKEGKFVINPQFEYCNSFTYGEGLAPFSTDDGKYGYIDEDGKYVVNPQFDFAGDFCDGVAFVKSNDKWGVIDKKGQYVVNPQFEMVKSPFLEYFSYVESEYYDASKFLKSFLSNFSSSQVDGMPSSSITLSDIASHEEYSESWKDNLWSHGLRINRNEEITDEITLHYVEFSFLNITYSFSNDWWSYDRMYNPAAVCSYIMYEFDLDHKAAYRSSSIGNSLCNKLKSVYGGSVSNLKSDEYMGTTVKKVEGGKTNFIVGASYSKLWLYVFFDQDTYNEALQKFSPDDEEADTPAVEETPVCEETTVEAVADSCWH